MLMIKTNDFRAIAERNDVEIVTFQLATNWVIACMAAFIPVPPLSMWWSGTRCGPTAGTSSGPSRARLFSSC